MRRVAPFVALVLALATWLVTAASAQAHGPDVNVTIEPAAVDSDRPLIRRYRAELLYVDKDPVEGARAVLTAARREGAGETLGPLTFASAGIPGHYVVEVAFARYGTWDVTVSVDSPGRGSATFLEAIEPSVPTGQVAAARTFAAYGSFSWEEALQVLVRAAHALAGAAWFGLTGLVLVGAVLLPGGARHWLLARMSGPFPKIAAASLVLMLASGTYTSVYSAPVRPPGIFDFDVMGRIPYGVPYLAAYFIKVGGLVLLAFIAYRMARSLARLRRNPPPAGGAIAVEESNDSLWFEVGELRRLSIFNVALGIILVLDLALLTYLHNLSHLGLIVPS